MFYELCLRAIEKHFAGECHSTVDQERQHQVRSSKIKAICINVKLTFKEKEKKNTSREYTCVNTMADQIGKSRFEFTCPMQNSFAKSKQFLWV